MLARNQRHDNEYNLKPCLDRKCKSTVDLTKRPQEPAITSIDSPSEVAFEITDRLVKLIEKGMSYDNLKKHGNIID